MGVHVSVCLCHLFSDRLNHVGPENEENRHASRENQSQVQAKQSQKNDSTSLGSLAGEDVHTNPDFLEGPGGDISDQGTDLLQAPTPMSSEIPGLSTPNRRRSKRTHTNKFFGVDQEDCAESDCDDPLSQEEKLRCAGPGCNAMICFYYYQDLCSNLKTKQVSSLLCRIGCCTKRRVVLRYHLCKERGSTRCSYP